MVPATVNFSILVKIDEVDQKLVTGEADKTGRVPTHSRARAGGKHCNFTSIYLQPTLLAHGMHHCSGQKLDRASSKGFFLPLGTEHLQFFLLLFAQRLAVPHLIIMWWQLVQKLFNSMFLSRAVNIRNLFLW